MNPRYRLGNPIHPHESEPDDDGHDYETCEFCGDQYQDDSGDERCRKSECRIPQEHRDMLNLLKEWCTIMKKPHQADHEIHVLNLIDSSKRLIFRAEGK